MSGKYDETLCHCALNRIFGYKPQIALALIDNLGSASALFELPAKDLDHLLDPYGKYRRQIHPGILDETEKELERLERSGCTFIGRNDPTFPPLLRECEDCPAGLYLKSASRPDEIFRNVPYIAIVGTRDLSPYGADWCRRIVGALASCKQKPVIVSGLALGTDITVHLAALECGLPTIAVLPTGIDSIYPSRHRSEASRIASSEGSALLTDYPPDTAPMAVTFLRRNRIIAGICRSTILTESKIKGGGMITARLAFSYGRDVYALPGRADDLRSQGCNLLLKEKVAEAIFDEDSLLESLGLEGHYEPEQADEAFGSYKEKLSSEQMEKTASVLLAIKQGQGTTIEEVCRKIGMAYQEAAAITAMLEADGFIISDLFQRYVINRNKK